MNGENDMRPARSRLQDALQELVQSLARFARYVAREGGPALRAFWSVAKPVLRTALQILAALLILLEEWGWLPLAVLLGRLAQWRPWAQAEYAIARLPPYAALLAFTVPTLLLLPLKFLALLLIANGQLIAAAVLFAAAKVVATALVARLFLLTQPALMQIAWFAWCYDRFMPWKEKLVERVRGTWVWRIGRLWKERAKKAGAVQWRAYGPTLLHLASMLRAAASGLGVLVRRAAEAIKARWAVRQQ
jgi:hypothetical protein